ncbi:unnamed protein product [Choristocarpus tenellus]
MPFLFMLFFRVNNIRTSHAYIKNNPDRIRKLNDIGFLWKSVRHSSFSKVVSALKTYKMLKGDSIVPSSFVVPLTLPWPSSLWGLRLGEALVDIRSKGRYLKGEGATQRRNQLEHLGAFDQSMGTVLKQMVLVLETYKRLVGNVNVTQKFVVPSEEPWPQESWGHQLGYFLYRLRRNPTRLKRYPDIKAKMDALGFQWDMPCKGPKGPHKTLDRL